MTKFCSKTYSISGSIDISNLCFLEFKGSLRGFIDCALLYAGSSFTVGVAESAPEPAPSQELAESAPEPAPSQELAESAPEPAPSQELAESAPEPAPSQELAEPAVREKRIRILLHSLVWINFQKKCKCLCLNFLCLYLAVSLGATGRFLFIGVVSTG